MSRPRWFACWNGRNGAGWHAARRRRACSAGHPAFGGADEGEEVPDVGVFGGGFGFEGGEGFAEVAVFFEEEFFIGRFQSGEVLGGKAAALEADAVQAADGGGVAIGDDEGGDVLDDFGEAADHGVIADADELMRAAETGDDDVVSDVDVAGEHGGVGQDVVVAELAIVGDVGVGEEEVVVPDGGGLAGAGGAVEGDVFAEDVVVADDQAGGFAGVFQVLAFDADGGEGEKFVPRSDGRAAVDDDVGVQLAIGSEGDSGFDDAKRADVAGGVDFGFRGDDGGGVDHGRAGLEKPGRAVFSDFGEGGGRCRGKPGLSRMGKRGRLFG